MKKHVILACLVLLGMCITARAQIAPQIQGAGAPANPCANGGQQYVDQTNHVIYGCPNSGGNWVNLGLGNLTGGGGSVTHTAGNLTAFHLMLGNGLADSTVDSACLTNGTGALSGCTSLSAGSGASAAGATATGGFACVEAASTGWTPTVGQDYIRCDSTLHSLVSSSNGVAEALLGGAALSGLTAAAASNTIANGNNPQTWNWAQTTDSQDGIAFGETSAAMNGTLTSGLANQAEVAISTATNSTATPFEVVQGSITNTVATPAMQIETTWNNAGLVGQGLFFNVTDTNAAGSAVLFNFQRNNTTVLSLGRGGPLLGFNPFGDFTYSVNSGNLHLGSNQGGKLVVPDIGLAYNSHTSVGSSATPNFDVSSGNVFTNTLTANVTGATLSNLRDSTFDLFELCQDGTGGRSFVWPTQMKDPPLVHQNVSVCKTYPFIYDGTSFYYTGGQSSVSNVVPVTVNANVATDQLLQAVPIPPNSLNIVGRTLDIWVAGVYTTTAANASTINVKAKLCTVSACGSGTVITLASLTSTANAGGQTNDPFSLQLSSTTQTGGASSVFEAHGNLTVDLTAAVASQVFGDPNTAVSSAIDTTGQLYLQITAAFSVASGSNSFTGRQLKATLN